MTFETEDPLEKRLIEEMDEDLKERYADYAVCMLRLQEMAGLTYKEARVYMHPNWETPMQLMDDLGLTDQSLCNLRRRAYAKVRDSGFTEDEIFGEYALDLWLIS